MQLCESQPETLLMGMPKTSRVLNSPHQIHRTGHRPGISAIVQYRTHKSNTNDNWASNPGYTPMHTPLLSNGSESYYEDLVKQRDADNSRNKNGPTHIIYDWKPRCLIKTPQTNKKTLIGDGPNRWPLPSARWSYKTLGNDSDTTRNRRNKNYRIPPNTLASDLTTQ